MRRMKKYTPTKFKTKDSVYDKAKADYAVSFIECLCHTKGTWAGKPFTLIDWQEQIIRDIFGIIKPNGYRQFNTAYIEIPKGDVTVKIDGIAASAASVIAMAGTKVLVSPVSMLMIHNPMTAAFGNSDEMQKAIEMLGSVKDSIINAYEIKTGLSRAKLSHLMDAETWMDANKAVELGFADEIMQRGTESEDVSAPTVSMLYSKANVVNSLMEKIAAKCAIEPKPAVQERTGRSVDELRAKLNTIKNYI